MIAYQAGKNDIAVDLITRALVIKPDYAKAHYNLGGAFKKLGKLDEAVASYHKALAIRPDYAKAHYNLGVIRPTRAPTAVGHPAIPRPRRAAP